MKVSNCYNCRSEQHGFYAEENGFALVKCDRCGLLFVDNRPDDDEILQAHMQGQHAGVSEFNATDKFTQGKVSRYLEVLEGLFNGDIGSCGHS